MATAASASAASAAGSLTLPFPISSSSTTPLLRPPYSTFPRRRLSLLPPRRRFGGVAVAVIGGPERSLEEIYNVRVERGVSEERLKELGVDRWSVWKTGGKCQFPWDWHVDQQVYVVKGEVRVVPEGTKSNDRYMRFVEGDLVRYPKWFEADLFFNAPYEERYCFRAYGDDDE